jgi:uncharacterized sporulation protein YeaH/YhbH (DUF444 family)
MTEVKAIMFGIMVSSGSIEIRRSEIAEKMYQP